MPTCIWCLADSCDDRIVLPCPAPYKPADAGSRLGVYLALFHDVNGTPTQEFTAKGYLRLTLPRDSAKYGKAVSIGPFNTDEHIHCYGIYNYARPSSNDELGYRARGVFTSTPHMRASTSLYMDIDTRMARLIGEAWERADLLAAIDGTAHKIMSKAGR